MESINVYINDTEENSIVISLDDNTTAQEVLRTITSKNQLIRETELHEYALFVKVEIVDATPLRERMLSSNECPLKIKKRVILDTRFKFVAKKCLSVPAPMEDNVLSDKNPSEEMIREGVLKKYSKGKWSDRYFILDAKCIFYGKDKKSIGKTFARIDLETVSIQDAPENGKYCFQLTIAQHNKYILKGNNTQNKEKWMQSISNQCSIVRENREFETINQNIRKEEKKRSTNDEKLISDCHNFEKLVQVEEGIKILIQFENQEEVKKCLFAILDYKNNKKPSLALTRAESKF
jgi:PH domain/Ras association (RalGDS/AF-6) domain